MLPGHRKSCFLADSQIVSNTLHVQQFMGYIIVSATMFLLVMTPIFKIVDFYKLGKYNILQW